ncbi:hybrid sensor histidine kinase/response regulator [Abyssalbus ytuae]|uniref:histidine kinase n=1 Tax=Abyssalbus ytuae TaxID=2926907 RepID=A0A9E6ZVZ1_9FLAO|nr:hybrid sensor histidine kinase/response regulator transcription factor [Abyssalbus ytuae]UOB17806.1 ATP-binding protein [Abyssalbus ytuae]
MLRIVYLSALFFLFSKSIFSQNVNYRFKNISTNNGLSQSSVIAIHQDKIGQMWVGTRDGLNKYDGEKISVYRNKSLDSLSISNDDILCIKEDDKGFLWIGTYNGLNKYDPVQDTFKRFFRIKDKHSLVSNTVWCIEEIDNEIWIGTTNGLSILDKENYKFKPLFYKEKDSSGIQGSFITKILKTNNNDIWIGTSKGLSRLIKRNENEFSFKTYSLGLNKYIKSSELMIQDLLEDDCGNIWIATKAQGIFLFNKQRDEIIKLSNTGRYKDLKAIDFRSLAIDEQNNIWLGANNGIYVISKNGEIEFINKPDLHKVKSIYVDANGSIWVGSYYGGLSLWDISNLNFTSINEKSALLNDNVVSSILSDSENNIFFGTEGGGISIWNRYNNKIKIINKKKFNDLNSDNIKSLMLTKDNHLVIGTFAKGMMAFDLKRNRVNKDYFHANLTGLINESSVYSIKKDIINPDILWIGTFGKGLIRYNSKNKSFYNFDNNSNSDKSLTSNRVRIILQGKGDKLWVGTQKGLNLISPVSDSSAIRVKHFFFDSATNSGVDILTVFEDHHHNIWVGAKSQGLFKFNGKNFERIKIISKENTTEFKSIHSILEDSKGNLWLSSNQGIARYSPNTNETIIYNQTDGLIDNEFNNNSALKLDTNYMYFGGPSGVSCFHPESIHENKYVPQVLLTDFKVKNQSVGINASDSILKKNIAFTKSLTLAYDKANFSINFSIPNFVNSDNNLYSYRLVGLDNEWTTTPHNEAMYTIQNPGIYTFEVKGANNAGIWNDIPTQLKIIVRPAPWRSWWAFTLYALLIGFGLFGLIWFSKSKTKLKHELELEHIENERIEELNKAKLQFFTNISHEFRTPLTLILGPLQQLLIDYKGSNKMHQKLLVIENNAKHLLQLINRLMDFRKLENDKLKLEASEDDIIAFLNNIFLSFTDYAKNRNYEYTFNTTHDKILVYYDSNKLEQVFFNLISNAFKFTKNGGSIAVNIYKDELNVVVEVEDSGIGVPNEHVDKIFERFFELSQNKKTKEDYNKGTGIGLAIAKHIVQLHKGNIEVDNSKDEGTIFRVTLQLGKNHLLDEEIFTAAGENGDEIGQYINQIDQEVYFDNDISDHVIDENNATILIVEDNAPLRSFLKVLLKEEYNIVEAENGKAALKKVMNNMPDLIISDVVMPQMTGTELCVKIKQNIKTSHIPFILLTSRTSQLYRFEGLEKGADVYINKPFDIKEFVLQIKNILESTSRLKNKFSQENSLTPGEITISSLDEELLKKAFRIVEENISNDQFDIPFFCSELGVSRTMLFTKIKAWTNLTPNNFIQEIKMKMAAQLLEQSKTNISQISYKVGFKDPKYFSKCFQKKFGVSPSEYQNKFYGEFD